MHNNKLITILRHFKKTDFNQFSKYINSPYFNKSRQLIHFFQVVEKGIHSSKESALEKHKIWKKIFPDQNYNDVRFRKLNSDLLKLVEGFLSQQIFDENKLQKAANLIESVGQKGIEKLYSTAIRIAENESEKYPYEDSDFYLKQYQIQKNYYELTQHEFRHGIRHNLEEIDLNLDRFYFSEKIRYACAALSQMQRGVHKYSLNFDNQVIERIKNFGSDIPSLSIYYQIYLTLTEEDNLDHYYRLKNLLKEYGLKFHSVEGKNIYDSTINYCIKKSNQGHINFLEELFEIYEDYLNKGLIYVDDELDPFHFKNIVHVSLRVKKYDWTEDFIRKNEEKLPESSRENAVTFNLARLYYYKKDYNKVISLLQEVEYEDIVYNLSAKSLLLATYYENDEIEPLYSLLESFRAFLNRRKDLTETKKRNYLNTIKFTRRLIKIIPGDSKAINKLKEDIEKTKDISDLKWLKQKIAELE